MKIKQLWVSKYKNLKDLTLEFNDGKLISLLVGQNGFGKSNLIEVLALIFKSLYRFQTLAEAKKWSENNDLLEYEIEYDCKKNTVRVACKYDVFKVDILSDKSYETISFTQFQKERKAFLPDYVLGYYSGNSPRLKILLEDIEDKEAEKLKNLSRGGKDDDLPLRSFIFCEPHHSEILLLTLIFFSKTKKYKKSINTLLKQYLLIDRVTGFEIQYNNPDWSLEFGGQDYSLNSLIDNLINKVPFPFWHLKGKVNSLLHYLNNQNEDDPKMIHRESKTDPLFKFREDSVNELLLFDNLNIGSIQDTITDYYKKPKDLFDALDSSEIVKIIDSIKTEVSKKDAGSLVSFSNLSEGEQQLITTIGLIIIFSEYDTLFLFDEPDTHLNPKWQRDYISIIKQFMPPEHADNSHLIVATHSPLLVQAADENSDLFLFRLSDNMKKIIVDYHDTRVLNWRIDHVLLSKYFDLTSTRPKSLDPFMKERDELLQKVKLDKKDLERIQKLADDFDQFPTGETLTDLKVLRKAFQYFKENETDN
ncbi:AAA family ATPase [Imperialibacter roseus]|uniref:AAA family ATPase n=1 Tax=Imperialibacter roseus TaxID=1324217 RepID=A0ABZ0J0Z5_9BACT|nr:AAA family ATPase [Imperialibacter roseus]WOK09622.1 AAA family ATPase [Imperialibacter roseus]